MLLKQLKKNYYLFFLIQFLKSSNDGFKISNILKQTKKFLEKKYPDKIPESLRSSVKYKYTCNRYNQFI